MKKEDLKTQAERFALILSGTSTKYRADDLIMRGFSEIGKGAWKVVFGSPKYNFVVKLSRSEDGDGMHEPINALTAPETLAPYLLPILAHGFRFQIQRRVEIRKCPASCRGTVHGMYDSHSDGANSHSDGSGGGKHNHTHSASGSLIIMDYGQDDQWYTA